MNKFLIPCLIFLFTLNLQAQMEEAETGVDFRIVDKVPVAKGCDPKWDNKALSSCFMQQVTREVVSGISLSFLKSQGLEPGIYSVYVLFTVNKKGKVAGVTADFENKAISEHIERAVRSIKKMEPAYLDDKPVGVKYALPVRFQI